VINLDDIQRIPEYNTCSDGLNLRTESTSELVGSATTLLVLMAARAKRNVPILLPQSCPPNRPPVLDPMVLDTMVIGRSCEVLIRTGATTVVGARCLIVCGLDRRGGTAAGSLMGKCKSAKTDCKSKIRNKYERARRSLAKTVERNGFRKFSYSQSYFTFSIRFLLVFFRFFIWANSKRIPLRSGLLMN